MIRSILITLCVTYSLGVSPLHAQEKFLAKSADAWGIQLKNSADAKARRSAAFALGKMGGRASSVIAAMKIAYLNEKDVKVREAIVFGLGEICRDVKSAYNAYLKQDVIAAEALRKVCPEICVGPAVGSDDLEKLFLGAIKEDNKYLRRSAAYALGCLASKSPTTQRALDAALDDREPMVRQNAAFALGQFAEGALPSLSKALRDSDSLVKRDAASVLLTMGDGDKVHEILKDLLPLCRDDNSETRRAALNVLVRIVDPSDKEAIEPLRASLNDKDTENKRNAALALCNIGGDPAVDALPVLLEAAKNGDVELRRQSVLAINRIGKAAKSAVPELVRFLREDKDTEVRKHAAMSLGGIRSNAEAAVPFLVQKLQETTEARDVRFECAMALSRMGPVPAAKDAVPALLAILGNSQQDVMIRERIMWALRVHREDLRTMNGTRDTFASIMKEPRNADNKMLRYDCAYMLGMIWQKDAPDHTLDLLLEFLRDDTVKVYDQTDIRVGGGTAETKGVKESIKERGKGDGRVMATDALQAMGPGRYAQRPDILKQLRVLGSDAALYPPLRMKAVELVKAAQ